MTQPRLLPNRHGWLAAAAAWLGIGAILLAMGRPPICGCGTVDLWHGAVQSSGNSQHLTDWYSFSHVIHGLLFYFFAHLLWRRWRLFDGAPAAWALPIAVGFEGFWEVLENSPMIIDRYRAVTVNWGYVGDSVVNSLADMAWMVGGFLLAARLAVWASIVLAISFELYTVMMIRDNLTLNVVMLFWPIEAVRDWQAGG